MTPPIQSSDLRGAARLATDATAGLTDLVEAMHERIARLPGIPASGPAGRTRGITGLVYKTIRGVTRVVGGSVDALLGLLEPALTATDDPVPQREALIAALNGVLGDHLDETGNPLATPMTLRRGGRALALDGARPVPGLEDAGPKVLVLIHGLCMNDLQWSRKGHDHGAALARELGFTPVYLRYNSGRHVSVNGLELAQRLEQLMAAWPRPVERLVLLGHSMGGLLARSATQQATEAGMGWVSKLDDMVFLGTPHHGAPLERGGNWVDTILGATPYASPFARLGKVRSAGITDLRHGSLLAQDWEGRDRFARGADPRRPVPLPVGVRCFAVASQLGEEQDGLPGKLLGDGLVPLDSALGRHRDPTRCLAFADDRHWVGQGIHHLDLLSDAAVFQQLQRWLAD